MPFKPTPGLIIVGIIVIIIFVGIIAAVVSGGGRKPANAAGQCTVTIIGDIGLFNVEISNQNTGGGPIVKTAADLGSMGFSFNVTKGDTIQVNATVLSDYKWNVWRFSTTGTWDKHNPLTIIITKDTVIVADCLLNTEG
jgi:hypothetical protein